jgi:hypothetical protein
MSARPQPAVPLADALRGSAPLQRLAERMRESKQRFACIQGLLPVPLAADVLPGPVDTDGWTLLARTSAVAAKLRQLVPLIEAELAQQQFCAVPVRVKVQLHV